MAKKFIIAPCLWLKFLEDVNDNLPTSTEHGMKRTKVGTAENLTKKQI